MNIVITKKSLEKLSIYEDYFRQAKLDYYRNMTSTEKNNLIKILEDEGSEVKDVCHSCGSSWLKLLKETGKKYEELKESHEKGRLDKGGSKRQGKKHKQP